MLNSARFSSLWKISSAVFLRSSVPSWRISSGEAIAHDYFRRTVALQQVYTNAVKGECENCKKMFGIMTGLIPPQNGGNT